MIHFPKIELCVRCSSPNSFCFFKSSPVIGLQQYVILSVPIVRTLSYANLTNMFTAVN